MSEETDNLNMPSMMGDPPKSLNHKDRKHLATLRRRRDYLEDLINRTDDECPSLAWDKSEKSALDWAINFIENSA